MHSETVQIFWQYLQEALDEMDEYDPDWKAVYARVFHSYLGHVRFPDETRWQSLPKGKYLMSVY